MSGKKVFFPIGNLEAYEAEVFYLAEMWHTSPVDIAHMPYSLRKRMCDRKDELERKRAAQSRNTGGRRPR